MSTGDKLLKDEGSKEQVVIAGGFAGLVSRFCIAPLDVIKIRLQLQTHAFGPTWLENRGAFPIIKIILREEGFRGFWRGNVPAELLYLTYGAAQFATYRSISNMLSPLDLPAPLSSFACGALAGATATTVTYPLDLLRTRFAAQGTSGLYRSFLSSWIHIWRAEGGQAFFQGLGAGVGQIVPYMGLFFAVYERLRPEMQQLGLPCGSGDAAAGIVASTVAKTGSFPLDTIRKRLQIQGPAREQFAGGVVPEYGKGLWRTGQAVVKNEGWRGLYRGLTVSLLKSAPASAITMWTYEKALKTLVAREAAQ